MEMNYKCKVTCPACNHHQVEKMPHGSCCGDSCTCHKCGCELKAKEDGTCVYCTYGDEACPATQKAGSSECQCCRS